MRRSPVAKPSVALLTLLVALGGAAAAHAAATTAAPPADAGLTRLLRYPDITGDTIVFSYGGDLWVVDADGGDAKRLTADPGLEFFPRFSPDGRQIAFMGEYSGTRQVFVIPVDGGAPKQLTFYNDVGQLPPRGGFDNQVIDWTPDGKGVVFVAHRQPWDKRRGKHYVVPAAGGMERPLGPPEGSGGSFSADGNRIAYTPMDRDFRTWKRYHGGQQQDVWIFDLAKKAAEQITDWKGTDNHPVWIGDRIYFGSDRERTVDLWAYDLGTKQTQRVAHHDGWDVLWPSGDSKRIVYEAGGHVWRFDPATGEDVRVPIHAVGDFAARLPRFADVSDEVESFDLSPSGARALFTARGEIFTAPAKEGEVRNLTRTPDVRERDAVWSPDGRWVAYWSDSTGEYELFVRPSDGTGLARRVTTDGASDPTWRYVALWSPDSKRLAFGDREARLRVVEVESGKVADVDRGTFNDITDYTWAPDSRWLAYSKAVSTRNGSIWVWSRDQGKAYRLTSDEMGEFSPAWDPKGRYLYFLSNRDFNLTFSGWEFDFVYTEPTRVYVGILAADGPALFLPVSDEEKPESPPGTFGAVSDAGSGDGSGAKASSRAVADAAVVADAADSKAKAAGKPVRVEIDVAGFEQRVKALPGDNGVYRSLAATPGGLLYVKGDGAGDLIFFNLEEKKEQTVASGVAGYSLSADGKKVLVHRDGAAGFSIVAPQASQDLGASALHLEGMQARIEPPGEWRQEFVDAWRLLRDWFYDPKMHGHDWLAMRQKYEPLVDHVAHRVDLDFILGELAGELNSGHVYVETSKDWQVPRREGGLLGAEIVADDSGHFRVDKIFAGENWQDAFRSPLTEPGVKVKQGDLILAVDGVSTKGVDNFYRLLENKAGRVVTLRVAAAADGKGAHEERVRPISSETSLRYLDWVASRRRRVEQATAGRIGYIHLPNTAVEGNRELFRGFYSQSTKDALILDDRYNGGGFIPFQMIQLLQRPLLSYWARRDLPPFPTPDYFNLGPKVTLTNGYAGSGGDAFPYYFRQRGLGKLVGTTTWGGLIGLSGNPNLMDGGAMNVPTFRFLDPEGMWAVEGIGVEPDVEVVDRPDLVAQGHDPTLEKGIQMLLDELKAHPPKPFVVPPPPAPEGRGGQ